MSEARASVYDRRPADGGTQLSAARSASHPGFRLLPRRRDRHPAEPTSASTTGAHSTSDEATTTRSSLEHEAVGHIAPRHTGSSRPKNGSLTVGDRVAVDPSAVCGGLRVLFLGARADPVHEPVHLRLRVSPDLVPSLLGRLLRVHGPAPRTRDSSRCLKSIRPRRRVPVQRVRRWVRLGGPGAGHAAR